MSKEHKSEVKRIAGMIDKIKDNLAQLIETVILVACIVLPLMVDVQGMFSDYLKDNYLTPNNIFPYLVIKGGKYAIAAGLFAFAYSKIRKHNKEATMNCRNVYHNYPYFWYCYCAKFLGIGKCDLILVPIYMQFKLVTQNIFNDYPLEENDYPVMADEPDIKVTKTNWSSNSHEINMILEDTYQIGIKQIPSKKSKLYLSTEKSPI